MVTIVMKYNYKMLAPKHYVLFFYDTKHALYSPNINSEQEGDIHVYRLCQKKTYNGIFISKKKFLILLPLQSNGYISASRQ